MFRFMFVKFVMLSAAVVGAGVLGSSPQASAQCGQSTAMSAAPNAYRSQYSGGSQIYRYRTGYQSGMGIAPSYGYSTPMRSYSSQGIVDQQSAYRRSLGKPF